MHEFGPRISVATTPWVVALLTAVAMLKLGLVLFRKQIKSTRPTLGLMGLAALLGITTGFAVRTQILIGLRRIP